jgi:hypothetical protein
MKRKHRAVIPDFSRKKPSAPGRPRPEDGAPPPNVKAATRHPVPNIKPQATSAKSGRRGQ